MISKAELKTQLAAAQAEAAAWRAKYEDLVAQIVKAMQEAQNPPPPTTQKGISVGGDFQNLGGAYQAKELDAMQAAGCNWVRVDFNYGAPAPGVAVADEARRRGMKVLAVLIARGGKVLTPAEMAAFATSVVADADAFEVWNEQNINSFWPSPNPEAYAAVYNAARDAIRAKRAVPVLSGGLSPAPNGSSTIAPADFLQRAMAAGMRPDAIGWHPYCSPAMPSGTPTWSAWTQMTQTPEWKAGAIPFWATEFGAPTGGTNDAAIVDEATQAKMIAEALRLWGSYPNTGPLFVYQGRDSNTSGNTTREEHYGLLRTDFSPKPALAAFKEAV